MRANVVTVDTMRRRIRRVWRRYVLPAYASRDAATLLTALIVANAGLDELLQAEEYAGDTAAERLRSARRPPPGGAPPGIPALPPRGDTGAPGLWPRALGARRRPEHAMGRGAAPIDSLACCAGRRRIVPPRGAGCRGDGGAGGQCSPRSVGAEGRYGPAVCSSSHFPRLDADSRRQTRTHACYLRSSAFVRVPYREI